MAEPTQARPRRFLVIATVVLVIAGLAGVIPALMSAMLFDSPGSESHSSVWLMFWSLFTFPATCLCAVIVSWILYALRRDRAARWATGMPVVNLVLFGMAFMYIMVFRGGQL